MFARNKNIYCIIHECKTVTNCTLALLSTGPKLRHTGPGPSRPIFYLFKPTGT